LVGRKDKGRKNGVDGKVSIQDARYRQLFESSSDAIMLLDRERFFDCNNATLAMFGLSREDFIRLHPSEISPPKQINGKDSRTEADQRIAEAFEKGVNRFEWIHRRSNGDDFAATVWLTAFPLDGKKVLQATVRELIQSKETQMGLEAQRLKLQMLLDEKTDNIKKEVVERKKAETELRRLIQAVETTFNAVVLLDMDMNFLYANNTFCKMARVSRDDLAKRNATDFIPEESLPILFDNIGKAKEGLEIEPVEILARNADGDVMWVQVAGSVLFGENGEPDCLLAIMNDVTERKNMYDALVESEEKFKMVVERSLDGILIIQDGKVVYMNPALVKLSGYTLEEQIGRNFIENVAPEARKNVMASYKARMSGKKVPHIYETMLMAKDGTRILIEVNAGVMEYKGRSANFVYIRDLTERQRTLNEIRVAKDRLEYVLGVTKTGYDIIDKHFNIIYVDPAWVSTHGDYRGRKCYDYFMGLNEVCDTCNITEALRTKKVVVTEKYREKEDSYIEAHTIPFKSGDNDWLVAEFNLDITERKKAHKTILEIMTFNESIITNSPIGLVSTDMEGNITKINPAALDILGSKSEKETMKFNVLTFEPLVKQGISKLFEKCLRGKEIRNQTTSYTSFWGKSIIANINLVPLITGGKQSGALLLIQDITEKKATEKALQTSEQVYKSLYESTMALGELNDIGGIMAVIAEQARNMLDGECSTIYLWNNDRKVLVPYFTNAPDEREKFMSFEIKPGFGLTGLVAERMEGSYANFNDPKAKKAYVPGTKSKKDHLQSVIAEPLMSEGKLVGVLNVIAEEHVFTNDDLMKLRILARQATIAYLHTRSLDELVKSEERFRKMGENIHDGLLIIEDGTANYINERAVEIYGYPAEELKNMSHMELVIPEDREQMRQVLEMSRQSGQTPGEIEFWIQRKDGSRRYVRTRTSTSMEDGKINQFIITTDITARKLAEDENKRKMMKYLLEDGRLYLVKEFRPSMSLEAFNDLLNMEYFGLVLSRTPKKDLLRSITRPFEHLWLGEQMEGEELFQKILTSVARMTGKSVVLIDRLDYLIFKYGFKETLAFIFRLRDQVYLKEQVIIVSMDTSTMKEGELNIMQKELNEIELRQIPKPSEELFEIAEMIYEKNSSGMKPSYSEIGGELKLSKPTFRKRVRHLINSGYAVEVTKGNKKVLELTQKGRGLFFK